MKKIYCFLVLIFLTFTAQNCISQSLAAIKSISEDEFAQLDAPQKSILVKQWNNASLQNTIPADIDKEAVMYYQQNNIDERIYRKYNIFFKAITNEQLPVSNRINLCKFIISNYDESIFPIALTKKVLTELKSTAK